MLDGLHQEHINLAKLLDLLREKLFSIRGEKPISYQLLKDILCYMSEVSDQRHHPKEELIYDYYLKYRCDDPALGEQLKSEHQQIVESGSALREMVEMILMDTVIPLDQFAARLEQFIVLQQRHMDFEEGQIFPALREALTEDDWRHLEHNWLYLTSDDPLFGREVAERYQELAKRLHFHDS